MTIKLTRLSRANVAALEEIATDDEKKVIDLGKTTAEFATSPADAVALVIAIRERARVEHGAKGHPAQSLHSVVKRLTEQVENGES